jgi:DNA repair exonuclease SbcCD ATPase subunit
MKVALTVVKDGIDYTFTRGKTATVTSPSWPNPKTGSKAYAEQLVAVFGCPSVILRSLVYRPQDTAGQFLSMSDADRKEYLTELLGLGAVETAASVADEKAAQLDARVVGLRATIQARQELIKGLTPVKPTLTTTEMLHDLYHEAKAAYDLQKAEFERLEAELTRRHTEELLARSQAVDVIELKLKKLREYALTVKAQDAEALRQFNRESTARANEVHELELELVQLESAETDLVNLRTELKAVLASKCPTCQQDWVAQDEHRTKLEVDIRAAQTTIDRRNDLEQALEEAIAYRSSLHYTPSEAGLKLAAKEQDLRLQLAEAKSQSITDPELKALQQAVQTAQQALNKASQAAAVADMNRTQADRDNAMRQRTYDEALAKLNKENEVVATVEAELATVLDEYGAEKDLAVALGRGGFLGVIFDEVLNEIASEANIRLAQLANVNNITIGFKSEWEQKSGKTKRSIVPVVNIGGMAAKYKTGPSGGQRSSVEQAVDLACRVVVGRRTGVSPGFLLLDECFNGQPAKTKEAAMEVLQEFAKDNLVVVIDHSTELKSSFSKIIKVTKQDEVSHIED